MVAQEISEEHASRVFRALADATRRDIVMRTLREDASISELAAHYDMSFTAVQKHVGVLEAADLIAKHVRGRERIVTGNAATVQKIRTLLGTFEQLWRGRIDRLDALLESEAAGPAPRDDARKNEPPAVHD